MFNELRECEAYEILQAVGPRIANLLTKQASVIVTTLSFLASSRSYLKEVVTPYQNIKTAVVLEAGQAHEDEILVLVNALTAQRKVKQSVFEDEGRDELKQQEIDRLVLVGQGGSGFMRTVGGRMARV